MSEKTESILPKFEEIEETWIVCVLAQPNMKPSRAAQLFVNRFDRFLELPDPDKDSKSEDKYFSIDKVIHAVRKKFYYFRKNEDAALYKPIQAKKALYSEVYKDLIDTYFITDYFELLNYMEEVYLGIEEYKAGKLKVLKEAANIRALLYKPNHQQEDTEDSTPEVGWVRKRATTRAEQAKINAERSRINAERADAETKKEN